MEATALAASVKFVAPPIMVPEAAFMNDTDPVQEAAVPLVGFDARLMRFTSIVSLGASPTSGNV
jgi:hypothetical protein